MRVWNYSLIHSVSFAMQSCLDSHIYLPAHLCHHHHSHHPSLLHCVTPGSKPAFSTNPSHLYTSSSPGLPSWSWDRSGLIMLFGVFLVRFSLFFFCFSCGGLSWLYTSAFYCTLLHIIIVPYRSAPVDYSIFSRFHVQVGTEMEFLARTACWRPMSVIVAGVAAACHGTATGSARQGENKEPALPAMCCAQPWHGGDIKISRSGQLCC